MAWYEWDAGSQGRPPARSLELSMRVKRILHTPSFVVGIYLMILLLLLLYDGSLRLVPPRMKELVFGTLGREEEKKGEERMR